MEVNVGVEGFGLARCWLVDVVVGGSGCDGVGGATTTGRAGCRMSSLDGGATTGRWW